MTRRVANKQRKQDPQSSIENKIIFSIWVIDCDVQDALLFLIFTNKHDTWFSLIFYCCKQAWGVEKGSIVMVALGDINIATPLQ